MKFVISSLIVLVTMMMFAVDANAVICTRGVYRAGCMERHGAVVYHRYAHYR
jgi:hypothetical protein